MPSDNFNVLNFVSEDEKLQDSPVGNTGYLTNKSQDIKNQINQSFIDEFNNEFDLKSLKTNLCIDWFSFSLYTNDENRIKPLLDVLKLNSFKYEKHGARWFKERRTYDENIEISLTGSKNKSGQDTGLLELSGQACREFERRGGNWYELFTTCIQIGGNATRIDIALDDFVNHITIDEVIKLVKHLGHYISRLQIRSFEVKDRVGKTIYWGNGNTQVCIYDKKVEQQDKGIEVYFKTWTRFEYRFRNKRANTLLYELIKVFGNSSNSSINDLYDENGVIMEDVHSFSEYAPKLINSVFELKKPNNYDVTNKYLWPIYPKWEKLLGTAQSSPLRNQAKLESTIQSKMLWIDRAVFKTLSYICFALGDIGDDKLFIDYIKSGIREVLDDYTSKDIAIINNFRREVYRNLINEQFIQSKFKEYKDIKCPIVHAKAKSGSIESLHISRANIEELKEHFSKIYNYDKHISNFEYSEELGSYDEKHYKDDDEEEVD